MCGTILMDEGDDEGDDVTAVIKLPDLPDDILHLIQLQRRILEAASRREDILRHATLHYVWSPGMKNSLGLCDLVAKVQTSNAVPFHNTSPFEVFLIDGIKVRVGMWEDRHDLIYLIADDVQTWAHVRYAWLGSHILKYSSIKCQRLRWKGEWINVSYSVS